MPMVGGLVPPSIADGVAAPPPQAASKKTADSRNETAEGRGASRSRHAAPLPWKLPAAIRECSPSLIMTYAYRRQCEFVPPGLTIPSATRRPAPRAGTPGRESLFRGRQRDRLAAFRRLFDRERHFERAARLARGGERAGLAERQMIEPGARFVGDRSPELAECPVARRSALHGHHVDRVIGQLDARNALLAVHQLIGVIVVEDHHAFGAEHFQARRVAERRILFRQRV